MSTRNFEDRLRSLRVRAAFAQAMIWLFVLVAVLVALFCLLMAVSEINSGMIMFMSNAPVLSLFLMLGAIPALIALCVWVWRAHANLRDDGRTELNYSPGWAVISLLIPGINLIVPMQTMRELWNRSHGLESWGARFSAPPVTKWWACFAPGAVIHGVFLFLVIFDMVTNVYITSPPALYALAMFGATVLLLVASWFLIGVIRGITRAQHDVTHVGDTFA